MKTMMMGKALPVVVVLGIAAMPVAGAAQGVAAGADVSVSATAKAEAGAGGMIVRIAARGEAEIIAALEAQGFAVVETGRTLLGRIRITAEGEAGTREVILHQRTGEVLRDVIFERAGDGAKAGATVGARVKGAVGGVLDGLGSGAAGATGQVGGAVSGAVGGALDGAAGGLSGSAGGSLTGGVTGGLGL